MSTFLSTMLASVVILVFFLDHSFAQISEDCDLFQINKLCSLDASNFLGELDNLDEVSCQEACHFNTECTHFTWSSFGPGHKASGSKCFLLTSCTSTTDCEGDCYASLSGPASPSYKNVCCGDFTGSACVQDGSNVITIEFNVPDEYECQKMCQEPSSSCSFFTFDSDVCILFSSCDQVEPCQSCVTGPALPNLDVCEEPSVGVLINGVGYNGYLISVEVADSGSICGDVLPNLNIPRKGGNSALLSGRILTCGGEDFDDIFYSECYSYEKGGNEWSEDSGLLEPRAYFSMEKVHGRIVVTGGEGKNGFLSSAESYRDGKWSPEPELELTSPRYRHCSVALDEDNLVVIGGKKKGFLNTILDLVEMKEVGGSGSWIGLPSLIQSREGHGCLVTHYQGRKGIMVAGGYTGTPGSTTRGAVTSHVEFYALDAGQWEVLPSLVQFREYHSLGLVNGVPSVFGGAKPEYLRSTEVFNGEEWVEGTELLTGRWAHSMVMVPKSWPRCPASKNNATIV